MSRFVKLPFYAEWRNTTLRQLQDASDEGVMREVLEQQLTQLVGAIGDSDLGFGPALAAIVRAKVQFVEATRGCRFGCPPGRPTACRGSGRY